MAVVNPRLYARCRLSQIESKYIFQLDIQDVMLISLISSINKIEDVGQLSVTQNNWYGSSEIPQDLNFENVLFSIFKKEFDLLKKLNGRNPGKWVFAQIYYAYESMLKIAIKLLADPVQKDNVYQLDLTDASAKTLYKILKFSQQKFLHTFEKEGKDFLKEKKIFTG